MSRPEHPICLLGASGMLGEALRRRAPAGGVATYGARPFASGLRYQWDGDGALDAWLDLHQISPSVIVLLAAQSSIDACHHDPAVSKKINVDLPAHVVEVARRRSIQVVFVSSDAVFDGIAAPYRDSDCPSPVLAYGRQKWAAEQVVLDTPGNLVVRLPKLLAERAHSQCFVTQWIQSVRDARRINCATDQILSPLSVDEAAMAMLSLVGHGVTGLVHLCSGVSVTRWALLQRLLESLETAGLPPPDVHACRLAALDLPEPRPLDTTMMPSTIVEQLGIALRTPFELIDCRAAAYMDAMA